MAQKTEKEETEFKVPEALSLCVNNCGFTGNPATNNMCQKCFSATTSASTITTTSNNMPSNSTTTTASSSSTTTTVTTMEAATTTTTSSFMTGSRILKFTGERSVRSSSSRSPVKDLVRDTSQRMVSDDASKREVNRCTGCRRKVGLAGFRCRCGELFCWEHRYSDRHDCSYDYKSAGREAIARENPVVKAAKIVRV